MFNKKQLQILREMQKMFKKQSFSELWDYIQDKEPTRAMMRQFDNDATSFISTVADRDDKEFYRRELSDIMASTI